MAQPQPQTSPDAGLLSNAMDIFVPTQPSVFADVNAKPEYPKHPITTLFHLLFKVAAILTYVFGGIVADNIVVTWVFVVIFVAFDFWVTKNVTGRLMVGLRWFNEVRPDGSTEWKFESQEGRVLINPYESKIFWIALIIAPLVWIICCIANLFSFNVQRLALNLLCAILTCSNLVGYIKCARDARVKLKKVAAGYLMNAAINQAIGSDAQQPASKPVSSNEVIV